MLGQSCRCSAALAGTGCPAPQKLRKAAGGDSHLSPGCHVPGAHTLSSSPGLSGTAQCAGSLLPSNMALLTAEQARPSVLTGRAGSLPRETRTLPDCPLLSNIHCTALGGNHSQS